MVAAIFARVHEHSEIEALAEHSSVPVINALSTDHHPLQAIADFQTLCEVLAPTHVSDSSLNLEGKRVAWVGDANNVLYDLASGCLMSGMDIAVATPPGYEIPDRMRAIIKGCAKGADSPGALYETNVPEEAVRHADVIVTDTWTSMGFEDETAKRLAAFEGFQVTEELAKRGMARKDWKFLHCLPRHKEEVDDEVFYGPRSCVWAEAQNRVWAAMCEWWWWWRY
jgi:ornithine carbamoyltransferase